MATTAATSAGGLAPRHSGLLTIVFITAVAGLAWGLLVVESWQVLTAILVSAILCFLAVQRYPALELTVTNALRASPRIAFVYGAALALLFPVVAGSNSYVLHLAVIAELYAVLALALNFQLGSANIPNFSTGASYGIGAYTSAMAALYWGVDFWLALPLAAVVATLFGFIIGVPAMRTRESYLALVTIAFAVVVHQLLNNLSWTGGPNGLVGIPAPSLFGHSFASRIEFWGLSLPSQANFYYLSLLLVGLSIVCAKRLHMSRVGLAWNALRADELAARCQGINVSWYKVLAFAVDAFLAAFAGTIYAFYVSYISPDNFTFLVSVTIMTMVILGGMDNIFGVVVGAFLLTVLPEKFRVFADYRLLIFGTIVIMMLIVRPSGLFPKRLRHYQGG